MGCTKEVTLNHGKSPTGDELKNRFTAWLKILIGRARIDYFRRFTDRFETVPLDTIADLKSKEDEHLVIHKHHNTFDFEDENLSKAFKRLNPLRQQLLRMLFIENLKAGEAAVELKCSIQYVYNERFLALKELKKYLKKEV